MTADTMSKDESIRLMQAEIERLRIECLAQSDCIDSYHQEITELRAEIERLRMESTKVGNSSYNPALILAERDAEIERLFGLLRWWVDAGPDADWDDYEQRVREALGD